MANLAVAYGALGQRDKALALQEQTLKVRRAKLGEDHPDTLASMYNIGIIYSQLGQHENALALFEQTLKLRRAKLGEAHPDTLNSMNAVAATYDVLGQRDKGLALHEQTLRLQRATLGEDHPDTLNSMHNLADAYRDLGQYDKALALQEQTLKRMRAKLGDDHPDTLTSMHNLAAIQNARGQHDKALALIEQTLKLRRAKLGEEHPDTLRSMVNLTITYSALGQHDKALGLEEQTLKRMRAKLGETHPDTLKSMSNLASTYGDLGQHDKALAGNEQTLKLRRAKLGENHPDTLASMHNLALNHVSLGQHDKVLALIPVIVSGAETLRARPGFSTEQRKSLFARYSDDYQRYAHMYASSGRLIEAFNLGDLSKARTLTDSIRAQSALRSLPVADQQKLQTIEMRAGKLQARLDELAAEGTPDATVMLLGPMLLGAEQAKHRLLVDELSERYPKYARLSSLQPATADQAKTLLAPDEAFVSYLIHTGGAAQAYVLDASGKVQWVDLGKIKNHAKTVAAYRKLVSSRDAAELAVGGLVPLEDGGAEWRETGAPKGALRADAARGSLDRYWHDKLIRPILPLVEGKRRWIVSPDKDLALLPFDLLAESFEKGEVAQRLVQTRDVTVVQSFAVFALLKQRGEEYASLERPKELFAMGNAVYGEGWAANRGIRRGSTRGFAAPGADNWGHAAALLPERNEQAAMKQLKWENLPGTAQEIAAISAVFGEKTDSGKVTVPGGKPGSVDSYLGPQASEGKLLELNAAGKLKDYRYLLFSAHGYLARNPALSSLVLSQKDNPPEVDGYVTADEWPLYDVRSDLTVLSACDTGVGKTQAGESVMGLPYALFVAGNKNTLLSLWPVDDDATAEFMRRFFTKLQAGVSQSKALSQTKLEFSREPKWSHPAFWAAFVLYGV